jgi:hypothetical protein
MPIFIRTHDGNNYRIGGERVRLAWRVARFFGMLLHLNEDPSGNDLWLSGREVVHFAPLTQDQLDAAKKEQDEARAKAQAEQGGAGRKIIETPDLMIPRKRTH